MTTTIHKAAGLLAIACALALTPNSAKAVITYTDGDLILGFRATAGTGSATDYLVDLGNAASIINSTIPITFSLGAIGTDLNSIYSGGWINRADVLWSVSGVQKFAGNGFGVNTMFATRSDTIVGPLGTNTTVPWLRPSSFAAGAPAGKVQSLGLQYGLGTTGGQTESTNAPGKGLIQPTSESNSYRFYQFGGGGSTATTAYGYFADSNGIEGNFGQGTALAVLDLYTVAPGSGQSAFVGNVTINDSASVTFTPTGFVVPEPTAGVALALGSVVVASLRRRRNS